MSTGQECLYVEVKPGEWYYVLEGYGAPKQAWDWREFADATGPFPTQEALRKHLHDNHANPGGASVRAYKEGYEPDEVMRKLIAEANDPRASMYRRAW